MFDNMFIVGMGGRMLSQPSMITFHYDNKHWNKFHFAEVIDKAPEWDGHTDKDVIERLLSL